MNLREYQNIHDICNISILFLESDQQSDSVHLLLSDGLCSN